MDQPLMWSSWSYNLQDGLMREYSKVKYRDKLIKLKETGKVDNDIKSCVVVQSESGGFLWKDKGTKRDFTTGCLCPSSKGWATYS